MTQIRTETRPAARWWSPAWWGQDARWLALVGPVLIFAGHALYGAMLPKTALSLGVAAALLLGACLLHPPLRREIGRVRGLAWPATLFGIVLFVGLWSLTPWTPGGPHPVWDYVGAAHGAATLDKSQTVLELTKLLGLACIFGIGLTIGASDSRARAAVNVILVLGVAVAAWSFADLASGNLGVGRQRLQGPFLAANTAATLFAVLLTLSLGTVASTSRLTPRGERFSALAPPVGAAAIFLAALLATASRGGSLAAAAGLVSFTLLQAFSGRMKWSRTMLLGLGAVVAVALAVAAAGDLLLTRLFADNLEIGGRQAVFQAHWEAFKGAPWMGYGLGSFDTVNRLLLDAENMRAIWSVRAAHNVYLTWIEQAGLLGALPMFACVAIVIVATLRNTLGRSRMTTILFALLAADVVALVHGATDFALETYSMAAFWALLLGVQFSSAQGRTTR